jgi:two-component system LytT family response regulator
MCPVAITDKGLFALQVARRLGPNLVLVDIDLSDMSGFDLLEKVREHSIPGIVVTTRTDCALRAYEAGALDYITKPVSSKRFLQAISRARQWLTGSEACQVGTGCPSVAHGSDSTSTRVMTLPQLLVGERQHRLYVLDPAEIHYVEADGNYVIFRAGCGEYISRNTLKHLEATLQVFGFLRIENSLLVNVGAIDYVVPIGRGRFAFTLRSGVSLRSSSTYRARILEWLPLGRGRVCEPEPRDDEVALTR